jgi:hypothetical protein
VCDREKRVVLTGWLELEIRHPALLPIRRNQGARQLGQHLPGALEEDGQPGVEEAVPGRTFELAAGEGRGLSRLLARLHRKLGVEACETGGLAA